MVLFKHHFYSLQLKGFLLISCSEDLDYFKYKFKKRKRGLYLMKMLDDGLQRKNFTISLDKTLCFGPTANKMKMSLSHQVKHYTEHQNFVFSTEF